MCHVIFFSDPAITLLEYDYGSKISGIVTVRSDTNLRIHLDMQLLKRDYYLEPLPI